MGNSNTGNTVKFIEVEPERFLISREFESVATEGLTILDASFTRLDGRELRTGIACWKEICKGRISYEIHGATIWLEALIDTNQEAWVAELREWSDKVLMWMNNSFHTYYYDRRGYRFYADILNEEGDTVPESVATCKSCGYTFGISEPHFVDGNCGACNHYAECGEDAVVPAL